MGQKRHCASGTVFLVLPWRPLLLAGCAAAVQTASRLGTPSTGAVGGGDKLVASQLTKPAGSHHKVAVALFGYEQAFVNTSLLKASKQAAGQPDSVLRTSHPAPLKDVAIKKPGHLEPASEKQNNSSAAATLKAEPASQSLELLKHSRRLGFDQTADVFAYAGDEAFDDAVGEQAQTSGSGSEIVALLLCIIGILVAVLAATSAQASGAAQSEDNRDGEAQDRDASLDKVDGNSDGVYSDGSGSGAQSDSTDQFAQRLEEIISQLSEMLRGSMKVYPAEAIDGEEKDMETWWYIGVQPGPQAEQSASPIVRGLSKWSKGTLGWWESAEAYSQGAQAICGVPLGAVADVNTEQADPTTVVVLLSKESQATGEVDYAVDNSTCRAAEPGVAYCSSKDLSDRSSSAGDPEARFGSTVQGVDEGDGWLRVVDRYLPTHLNGKRVIRRHGDYVFQFKSWKAAKTWASTLAALIEQLHDEY
eukprot:TRINITY_DN42385_c0_g1_i1.p1 TRINITY_DN42385_c0_g1~~TRINITY_DN42385_c0_g1_i1.p1  ORF type:complete len:475 (+),score=108.79 TRINITY_DN42385_c0_g1_i1:147-1571(+)